MNASHKPMKIVIEQVPLDSIDAELLKQRGADAGSAVAVSFEGNINGVDLGKALGAVTRGWLQNVRFGSENGPHPTPEQEEAILQQVLMAFAYSLSVAIKTSGGVPQ